MGKNPILEKEKIRKNILIQRQSLSNSKRENLELQMKDILQSWEVFKNSRTIHIYISKIDEPKTFNIIKLCWESSKKVVVPYISKKTNELFHSELNSFNDLKMGSFGVYEPSPNKRIESNPESFDLVIVPGIAFDINGGRIGYGKGFYDRFLLQTSAFRLALAYEFQIIKKIPIESHDIKMDGIITETRKILI